MAALAIGTAFILGFNWWTSPRRKAIATGTIERVTIWAQPVQRPGETGSNSGHQAPKGSRVEVYEHFILVTPAGGPTELSPHGWYTNLEFRAN
ncbi:hypothetical protein [Limnoglobus roseus]|nr:hypothetical protein [Limnoglobus roseus]